MPKYVTIGYGDEAGYRRTPDETRRAAHAHDTTLANSGAVIGRAGRPVQVRNPEGTGTITERAAFLHAALPVAGFAIIEADDIEQAIGMVAGTPCAVAHGVVEVWPLIDN